MSRFQVGNERGMLGRCDSEDQGLLEQAKIHGGRCSDMNSIDDDYGCWPCEDSVYMRRLYTITSEGHLSITRAI